MMKAFKIWGVVSMIVVALLVGALAQAQGETVLPVKFKAQVPPGTWSNTSNCGQASMNMAISFHDGVTPTAEGIMDIDDWLADSKWDRAINNYNGSGTRYWMLEDVAKYYGGYPDSYADHGWTIADIKWAIDQGRPVVCGVYASYLSNRGYGYTGAHWIVAIGYTDSAIICNDPGSANGGSKHYSNSDFSGAHGRDAGNDWPAGTVIVVVTGNEEPPPPEDPRLPPVTEDPPVDSDEDGVTDDIDQCPYTLPETEVDAVGCAVIIEPPPPPEERPFVEEPPAVEEPQPEEPSTVRRWIGLDRWRDLQRNRYEEPQTEERSVVEEAPVAEEVQREESSRVRRWNSLDRWRDSQRDRYLRYRTWR